MIALAAGPSVPLAFLAGLVSFLSPCVFPLIPAYAAYLGGRAGGPVLATAEGPALEENSVRVPVIANGIAFVAGFSLVFIAVYYVLQVLDVTVFIRNLQLVNAIAGGLIIVLALQTLGVLRFGFLARDRRLHITPVYGTEGTLRGYAKVALLSLAGIDDIGSWSRRTRAARALRAATTSTIASRT